MMCVLDDLRPEPRLQMWQKFDTEGIVHKEYVPPGQTVNGKFYCDCLRRLWENIRRKFPDQWRNNSWAVYHDNAPTHVSLVVQQFLASTNMESSPTLPTHWASSPVIFSYSRRWNWSLGLTFWRHWRDPDRLAGRDEDADAKWLTAVLPVMEIPLVSLYQCRRGLLRME
jgi:hypothetical protein